MREARHFVSPGRRGQVAPQLVVEGHGYAHAFGKVGALAPDTRHAKVAGVTFIPCGHTGWHREFLIDEDVQTARIPVGIVTSAKVLKVHADTHSLRGWR
jgi:hypothetical protein